jgi:hypothetical protein
MLETPQGRSVQYNLIGFSSNDDARAAADRVAQAINQLSSELNLSLAGLDGVTIAHDYDAALAQLDRGYQVSAPLTRTNDSDAQGCAMAPLVMRNGEVMSHLVLSAFIVPLIAAPQSGVDGKYILGHELAHVHEHYFRNRVLPNTLLKVRITKADEAFLHELADTCWGEYVACIFSAPIHPEQAKLFEMPLLELLPKARYEIEAAKKGWLVDRDIAKFWQRAGTTVYSLLKYFSYLLGHAAGLSQSIGDIAPETWSLLNSNAWLLSSVEGLNRELSRMYETFDEWKSLAVFEPLKQLERTLFADCGIGIADRDGSLYVSLGPGKLPQSL